MSKVLIIDDSKHIHALVRAGLEERLASSAPTVTEVHSAFGGAEGLRLAQQVRPDLVLLDMTMPDLGGLEVCRRLAELPATRSTPVIFLTGQDSVPDKILGLNAGAVDYMTKPFDAGELRARVRATLRRAVRPPAAPAPEPTPALS